MVPRVRDNNPWYAKDFKEEKAREGRQGNFKISQLTTFKLIYSRCR